MATDTINYVATDQNGLTSTSTVIIEASPWIVPTDDQALGANSQTVRVAISVGVPASDCLTARTASAGACVG